MCFLRFIIFIARIFDTCIDIFLWEEQVRTSFKGMKLFFAICTENKKAQSAMSWILIFIYFCWSFALWTLSKIFHSFYSSCDAKFLVFFYHFLWHFNYFKIFFSYICGALWFLIKRRAFQFLNLTGLNNILRILF